MDYENQVIEQLKQISSKLDALNNKKEERDFQVNVLKIQVKQGNIVMLLTTVVSIAVAFLVGYFTVIMTGIIPTEISNIVVWALAIQYFVMIGIVSVIGLSMNYLMMKQIDTLKNKT